jgi:hypothetical protein
VHGLATVCRSAPSPAPWTYAPAVEPSGTEQDLLARFAPCFVVEEGAAPWNLIGTPTLARRAGVERARVDTARAVLYAEARRERVGAREVHQLVYRIHFDQLAPTPATFLSMHRNAGLLVLVTVDREALVPLVVTTVHTCGCWLAVQPTTALAGAALPVDWPAVHLAVAGETLRARLAVPDAGERFVVALRTRSHRVHDVRVADPRTLATENARALPLHAVEELRRLPIAGTRGETGSFFYTRGYLRGYVRGAWVPLEGLTLGLLTLDPRLGMDRDFGDPDETGARFFTALAPWKREASRLDRFGRALGALGFRPQAFGPERGG